MKTFKIELIKIGRDDYSEIITHNFINKKIACQWAINEAGKHLMSRGISMSDNDNDDTLFTVFAGFRNVGQIKITQKKE